MKLLPVFIFLFFSSMVFALACGDTIVANTVMAGDLTCTDMDGLIIGAAGVEFNCAGFSLIGVTTGSGYDGIQIANVNNVVIKNCIISGYEGNSIYLNGGNNTIINNNSIIGSGIGISIGTYSNAAMNSNITNNTFTSSMFYDIGLYYSYCNQSITNNIGTGGLPISYYQNSNYSIADQTLSQLIMCNTSNSTITNVTINTFKNFPSPNSIHVSDSTNVNITNCNIIKGGTGIELDRVTYAIVKDNLFTFQSRGQFGISLAYADNSTFLNNTASNAGQGISLIYSSYNQFTNNTITNSNDQAIYDLGDGYNNYTGNLFNDSGSCGFYSWSSTNNTFKDNTFSNNGVTGYNGEEDIHLGNAAAKDNLFYNNKFLSTHLIYNGGGSSNTWNITKTLQTNIIGGANIGGNSYSTFSGVDTDYDGISNYPDTFAIATDYDYLPLTNVLGTVTTTLNSPANNSYYTVDSVTLNWTCTGNLDSYLANITVSGIGSMVAVASLNNTPTDEVWQPFPDGVYTWNVTCYNDSITNTSEVRTVTVDTIAPSITINSPTNTTYNNTFVNLNFVATDATSGINTSTCNYTLNGVTTSLPSCNNISIPTAPNFYELNVSATDNAGNSNTSATISFTVVAPAINITITGGNSSIFYGQNATVDYSLTNDGADGVNCNQTLDGNTTFLANITGNSTGSINFTNLSIGNHIVNITCGNTTAGIDDLTSMDFGITVFTNVFGVIITGGNSSIIDGQNATVNYAITNVYPFGVSCNYNVSGSITPLGNFAGNATGSILLSGLGIGFYPVTVICGNATAGLADVTSNVFTVGVYNGSQVYFACYDEILEYPKPFSLHIYSENASVIVSNLTSNYTVPTILLQGGMKKIYSNCQNGTTRLYLWNNGTYAVDFYSLNTWEGQYYYFYIKDTFGNPLPNATLTAYRWSDSKQAQVVVEQGLTDITGYTYLFLERQYPYRMTLSKDGYLLMNFDYVPLPDITTSTITMTPNTTTTVGASGHILDGVSIIITPTISQLPNVTTNITFTAVATNADLESFSMNITEQCPNGTSTLVYNNTVLSSTGGSVAYAPSNSSQCTYAVEVGIKKQNQSAIFYPTVYYNGGGVVKEIGIAIDYIKLFLTQPNAMLDAWFVYLIFVVISMMVGGFISRYSWVGAGLVSVCILGAGTILLGDIPIAIIGIISITAGQLTLLTVIMTVGVVYLMSDKV